MESIKDMPSHWVLPHWHRDEQGTWCIRGAARHFTENKINIWNHRDQTFKEIDLNEYEEVKRYKAYEPMRYGQISPYVFSAVLYRKKERCT